MELPTATEAHRESFKSKALIFEEREKSATNLIREAIQIGEFQVNLNFELSIDSIERFKKLGYEVELRHSELPTIKW